MQIGTTRSDASILPLATVGRSPEITARASTSVDGAASSTPETAASSWPVDEQAFFDVWGTDDAAHDLDGSGRVDGADLGQWLSAQSEAATDSDVQGLLDAWGTADTEWDLNGDGIVDGLDLGIQLNGGVEGGTAGSTAAEAELNVEGFAAAWGTSDTAYDLNADGIVDGADLGLFLDQSNVSTQDVDRMERFMAAWGTNDAEFDFNGDGTVDGLDLGHLLGEETSPELRVPASSEIDDLVERLTQATMRRFDHGRDGLVSVRVFELAGGSMPAFDTDGDGMLNRDEVAGMIRSRIEGMQNEQGLLDGSVIDRFAAKWRNFTAPVELGGQAVQFANQQRGMKVIGSLDPNVPSRNAANVAASRVANTLGKLGHEGIPSNLPTLLDRLSLPGTNSQAVMYELIQQNGIGAVEETA